MPPPPDNQLQDHGATPPPSKPHPVLLSFFLKAIIMTVITSFFFLILPLASFLLLLPLLLRHHCRRQGLRLHCPTSSGFSSKHIRKLSQFRFRQEMASRYCESGCVICLDGFRQGQSCRQLVGCGHVFHRRCVDSWLLKVAACPICRERVWVEQ